MKMQKRIPALVLALGLALAFTAGCSGQDTSWIAQNGEDTVPVGVYMVEMMMGYNDAAGQLPGSGDILKESIGEVPAVQYISDFAKAECAKLLTVRKEFAGRGLVLSAEELEQAASYTDYLYSVGESFYSANGVAKESVGYINDTSMMMLAVFNSIYGEGGEREVPRADLEKEFAGTFTRSQFVFIPKIDMLTGGPLSEEELAAAKEKADDYLARAKAGEEMSVLYNEVMAELYPDNTVEQPLNDTYLENNAGYFYPGYESTVVAAADNEIRLVEEDDVYFLIKKLPLMGGDAETTEEYLSSLLQNMKYDEYMDLLAEWGQNIDIRYNNAALAAYTPSKLKMTQEQLAAAAAENSSQENAGEDAGPEEADQSPEGSQPAEGPDQG